jgi:hypothetical protein
VSVIRLSLESLPLPGVAKALLIQLTTVLPSSTQREKSCKLILVAKVRSFAWILIAGYRVPLTDPVKFLNTRLVSCTLPVSGVTVFCQYWSMLKPYELSLERKFSQVTLVTYPEPPGYVLINEISLPPMTEIFEACYLIIS